jgi:uncharacterized protein YndB with AHSA1/START domain
MNTLKTSHDTIVVARTYDATAQRVFAAWADAAALGRWYLPGDAGWTSRVVAHEFRVGGRKQLTFGPKGGPLYSEDCRYEDIVENWRICFAMTISRGSVRITTSMVTVELFPEGARTRVKVTDQCAALDGGDTAADRERGWGETLDKLPTELARNV